MNSLTKSSTEGMNGTPHGRIPPNMLLCDPRKGHEKYIWYNPPQKERCTSNPVCTLLTEHSMFPGLFMWWNRESMDVHAFKGTVPQEQTELFTLAPFFNVTGADVCLGNSSLEKPLDTDFSGFQNTGRNVSGLASSRIWEAAGTRHAATWFP